MAAAEASVEATEGRKLSAGGRPSTTFGNRCAPMGVGNTVGPAGFPIEKKVLAENEVGIKFR